MREKRTFVVVPLVCRTSKMSLLLWVSDLRGNFFLPYQIRTFPTGIARIIFSVDHAFVLQ